MTVKLGDTFTAAHADSNFRFTVIEKAGRHAWICRMDDNPDWGAVERAFTTPEIESAMAWEASFAKSRAKHIDFWESVTPGATLHYHNGFGEYVRCVVTDDHELRAVALVGNWTGRLDYYVEKIERGDSFQPHVSNIFEAPGFVAPRHPNAPADPTVLEPLAYELRRNTLGHPMYVLV